MKYDLKAVAKKNRAMALHLRRKARVRKVIVGTKERPRLSVFKSAKHIYVQAIDDALSVTMASSASVDGGIRDRIKGLKKVDIAKLVGEEIGKKLKESNCGCAVFDRNGFRYTGRVAAVADAIRACGIQI